ncbi:MFS transporter [Lentilactobacillus sp. Marseille-Q4993]|uniref:MFS transporter n=1 Tax=Lentilactobacillus sp. Marseille-Q4993 TaxID=3039492 RepID=UPI0024BC36A2|nr:MFS transporter [Lentilactobacillus sp. Marseille-Q4993]
MTNNVDPENSTIQAITVSESKVQIVKDVTGNLISSFSSGMFSLALGLMLLSETHSPIAFGLESAITPIVSILTMIPVGNITDRYPHKRIIIFCSLIKIIALTIFWLTIDYFSGFSKLVPVAILLVILSTTGNFSTTAYTASVKELVSPDFIPRLGSLTQSASSLSSVLAPIVGVALYSAVKFDTFVLISIIASIAWLGITLSMKFHYQRNENKSISRTNNSLKNQLTQFMEGLHYILNRKMMRDLILIACMINFLFVAVTVGLPYTIVHQIHAGNSAVGIIDGFFSAGILAGSILLSIFPGRKHLLVKIVIPLVIMSVAIFLIGIFNLTYTTPLLFTVLCSGTLATAGVFNSVLNISSSVYMQLTVPTHMLGRVMSTFIALVTCISPLGSLLFTFAFKFISNGAYIFISTGLFLFIYILLFLPLLVRDMRADIKRTERAE